MSSTVGKIMGAGGNSTKMYGSESNVLKYLNGVDTSGVDNTLSNLANFGQISSQNINNMGNYNFSADGSDEARQRAEQATHKSYMDRLNPQFTQQTNDMQTRLVNQGLTPGSEAYQRAMNDLQQQQGDQANQAAYQSTLAGQNAFTQSLGDQINSGGFSNNAQQAYINQILSAINGSPSGYDKNMDIFGIQSGADNRISQNKAANKAAQAQAGNQALQTGAMAAMMAFSDKRLKENIKSVGKLDNGLAVYLFNYIGENKPQIGLIAQEVQEVKPDAVIENEDGYLMVDYSKATEA